MTVFGQLVIGPPGAGKSTYCYGLHQFLTALERPVSIINLDPATPETVYPCAASITSLICLQEVMDTLGLGPNGALLYCFEYLEANFDWLESTIAGLGNDAYVILDLPGQAELSTDHDSLRRIIARLTKLDVRVRQKRCFALTRQLCAVHLTDAHHVTDASKYVSIVLLALRAMLQLELPHINVLSKVDLIAQYGDLPFNLDFYTQVQDLSYLEHLLDSESGPRKAKFAEMNRAICGLIEDFALVSFETLAVEDKESMASLIKTIDSAIGYVPRRAQVGEQSLPREEFDPSLLLRSVEANSRSLDVQEKYVDRKEAYREHEREGWRREGDIAIDRANAEAKARALAANVD